MSLFFPSAKSLAERLVGILVANGKALDRPMGELPILPWVRYTPLEQGFLIEAVEDLVKSYGFGHLLNEPEEALEPEVEVDIDAGDPTSVPPPSSACRASSTYEVMKLLWNGRNYGLVPKSKWSSVMSDVDMETIVRAGDQLEIYLDESPFFEWVAALVVPVGDKLGLKVYHYPTVKVSTLDDLTGNYAHIIPESGPVNTASSAPPEGVRWRGRCLTPEESENFVRMWKIEAQLSKAQSDLLGLASLISSLDLELSTAQKKSS
jgi:hypothetical protein